MNATARVEAVDDGVGAMLRQSVQDFCARHQGVVRTRRLRDSEPGYDDGVWKAMAHAGWTGIALPETAGGLGLGLREICIVAEELAADLAPEPFGPATIAGLAIARGDNSELGETLLSGVAAGEIVPAFAWQEEAGTTDPANCETVISRSTSGGLVLSGRKAFVPAASGATGYVVTAKQAGELVLVWVAAGSAGTSLEAHLCVDGSWMHTLRFDDVQLGANAIVASPQAAAALLLRLIDEAAVIASAELLGIIRAAFDRTHAYLGQRNQFGKPIGSFQVLQHRLVDLWMQQELVSALLDEAIKACAGSDPDSIPRAASAAKAKAASTAVLVGRQSIQLHGAIGYADEHDIGLYLKRAIVKSAWVGGASVHRKRLARLFGYSRGE